MKSSNVFRPIVFVAFWLVMVPLAAQKVDVAYAKMLEGMYENTVPLITSAELDKTMKQEKVYLLDTRTPAEYNTSHIKGATFINYDFFNVKKLADVPKNAKVVLYCSVGWRSERIGEKLMRNGYTHVYNLYGGLFEWYNEGYPVYDKNGETDDIHTYDSNWGKWVKKRK